MKVVSYLGSVPIIDDDTPTDYLFAADLGRGHDPSQYVSEMFASPSEITLVDPSNYGPLIEQQTVSESSLEHVFRRAGWENLDQNGQGYCWAYSTTHCVMMLRSIMNQPHVRLSAHAIGCKVKGFRDEGGWCGLSCKFHRDYGCPSVQQWAEKSMSRSYDTSATWENAAHHKITEDWYDLAKPVHGQELTDQQISTCLLNNVPCALDFNWWGHSVCGLRLVKVESGSYGKLFLNSWRGWGDRGLAVLRGSKARADGAVALRVTGASTS